MEDEKNCVADALRDIRLYWRRIVENRDILSHTCEYSENSCFVHGNFVIPRVMEKVPLRRNDMINK